MNFSPASIFPSFQCVAMIVAMLGGLGAGFLTGCGPSSSEPEVLREIQIALEPDRDPEAIIEDSKHFQDFLKATTGLPVRIVVPLSSSIIREGFRNGTLDIGYINSTAAVRLGDTVEVLVATAIDGRPYYESYWLSLREKPYQSIADLQGKPIAFSSRTSTSGFIVPTAHLLKRGLITPEAGPEGFFGSGNVHFGIGYVSAVDRVLDGSAEAAAVSYYVYEQDRHLTAEQRARLKVIDRSGPVPTHVLAIRSSLPRETIESLKQALLQFHESEPERSIRLFGAPLIQVDSAAHLAPAVEALKAIESIRF